MHCPDCCCGRLIAAAAERLLVTTVTSRETRQLVVSPVLPLPLRVPLCMGFVHFRSESDGVGGEDAAQFTTHCVADHASHAHSAVLLRGHRCYDALYGIWWLALPARSVSADTGVRFSHGCKANSRMTHPFVEALNTSEVMPCIWREVWPARLVPQRCQRMRQRNGPAQLRSGLPLSLL